MKQQYTAKHCNTMLQCVATVCSHGNGGEGRERMRRERGWGQKRGGQTGSVTEKNGAVTVGLEINTCVA